MSLGWLYKALAVNLLIGSAVHAARPLASYRALDLGATPIDLGLLAAAFALVSLLAALAAGRWVDRSGEIPLIIGGSIGVSLAAVLLTLSTSLPTLALGVAALGLFQVLTAVSIQALIANAGGAQRSDTLFGWQGIVASLGQLLGPIMAGFVAGIPSTQGGAPSLSGMRSAFVVASVAAAGGAALAAWLAARSNRRPDAKAERPRPTATAASSFGRVLRLPSMSQAMFASLAVLASVDVLIVYLPAFAVSAGIGVEVVGLLLATRAGAAILSRALIPLLRTRLRRSQLLAVAMLAPAIALAAFPLVGWLPAMFGLMVIIGFGLGLGQPLTLAWVAARAPTDLRGTAIGLRLSGNRLGQLVVPAVAGVAASILGLAAVFWSVSLMLSAGALFVMRARFEEAG